MVDFIIKDEIKDKDSGYIEIELQDETLSISEGYSTICIPFSTLEEILCKKRAFEAARDKFLQSSSEQTSE